ncbi:DUF309 domain-containing protein [Mycolicibacterium frederiksbergense]|uniref:DUF309 domain-containing protein n=1 Tax=Mycolicibacterium frederiksbergense TaxID=117567 RepID=A0A6H0SDA0_9MYCO|nr:DUF309 domain-containing protein [Mycolicibacterium frederiksbergense]
MFRRSLRTSSATTVGRAPRCGRPSASGCCQAVPVGSDAERDRDDTGRPRNTRPRDALGRPLPYGSTGVPRIPDDLRLSPTETLRYAQDLLDRGQAFGAHEVLESAWKDGPDSERALWQGLAQLAVGITHVQRGNPTGAATLLRRAAGRLRPIELPAPYGIDVAGLIDRAQALADDLDGGRDIAPDRLRIRLLGAD